MWWFLVHISLIFSRNRRCGIPIFERVFRGETIQQNGVGIVSRGIESYWDVVISPLYDGDQIIGLLNVSIDATERMTILHNLEERVQERTEEIERRRQAVEGLWETLRVINSNASLDEPWIHCCQLMR